MAASVVRTSKPSDESALVHTIVLAFAADPVARWAWPTAERYLAAMSSFGVAGTLAFVIAVTASASLVARQGGAALEESIPAGENFDKADFKLWLPDGQGAIKAILVLVPGSNGDGRPMHKNPGLAPGFRFLCEVPTYAR